MMETNAISLWQKDYPSSLYPNEYADPLGIIQHFFSQYCLREVQIALWNWLPFQVTDEIRPTAEQRFFLFRLGNQLERLVDAAWVLVNQHKEITYQTDPNITEWIHTDKLAFLYHHKKWSQEWHPSAAYRLFQHYGDLYRLMHLAHYLTIHTGIQSADESSTRIVDALQKKFSSISIGRTGRFLTGCITLSRTFSEKFQRLKPDEKELKHAEEIQ